MPSSTQRLSICAVFLSALVVACDGSAANLTPVYSSPTNAPGATATPTGAATLAPTTAPTASSVPATTMPSSSPTTAPTATASPSASAPPSTSTPVPPTPSPVATATPTASGAITITETGRASGGSNLYVPNQPSGCPANYYSDTFTASEPGVTTFVAVSSSPTQVTVSPATGAGMFTVTEPTSNTNNTKTTIVVSDGKGNTANATVNFNVICL